MLYPNPRAAGAPGLSVDANGAADGQATRLSYKFQRLRERIRDAVVSGELSGKLPGERELAKRFKANPKTLSKALTDLAAEGLLDRSIGRGTYVKGSGASPARDPGRWLVIARDADAHLAAAIGRTRPDVSFASPDGELRPSFISNFEAVLDLAGMPAAFYRDLSVRGIPVVCAGLEPAGEYRAHSAGLDRAHAASTLARDLFLAGHRRIAVVEAPGQRLASDAARRAAERYAPHAAVRSVSPANLELDEGITAVLCDGAEAAQRASGALSARQPAVAIVAFACWDQPTCTGIFVTCDQVAAAAATLARDAQSHRPTALWLSGTYAEKGTLFAIPERRTEVIALSA